MNRNDLINSVYLCWISRLCSLICFQSTGVISNWNTYSSMFLSSVYFFYLSFKRKIIYNDVKLCHQIEVFTPEYLDAKNKLHEASVSSQFILLTISKLKQINNKSFYRLLIIFLGEISLNPGPVCRYQLLNTSFSKQKVCI